MMRKRRFQGTGLGLSCGMGKSRPVVERIQALHKAGHANLVLITNVLSGLHVWVGEWDLWSDIPAIFIDLRETKSEGLRIAK
ncbi:MAG: hypothetical protein OK454_00760, partial [Thaumarchaeota archaeon]|nr:hypothetical protein [Nitrososphaerota archaeon]